MKGFSLLVTIAVSAGYAHGAGTTLRASAETMLDSTSRCNPNQESFLVCLNGSTGAAWNSCGPKNGRKYCPKGYAMCGDGSCFRKASQCFRRGGLEYGKSVCVIESASCNPNHLDVLVCSDGSKGKHNSDWNACGRNWKKSGSRKYCPRNFYQCGNGLCFKYKNACRGSPIKFIPCALGDAIAIEETEPAARCKYTQEELNTYVKLAEDKARDEAELIAEHKADEIAAEAEWKADARAEEIAEGIVKLNRKKLAEAEKYAANMLLRLKESTLAEEIAVKEAEIAVKEAALLASELERYKKKLAYTEKACRISAS